MHSVRLLWAAYNEELWQRRKRRFLHRSYMDKIAEMPESLFVELFRLNKQTFWRLCHELKSEKLIKGTREIPIEIKVFCALTFFATGSYQRIVGISHHLTQRTASRCIRQVVDALNNNALVEKWIVFPQTQQERTRIKQEFQRKYGLPGVVGCIDCTHIAIVKPNVDEHLFYNRKGYHSLNVQMICDSNLQIMNVNAKFGGATHDSFIWSSSQVEPYMRRVHQNHEQVWLLGDSGYPQRPWLMTPLLNAAAGSREDTYTRRHIQARNCIERCFGLLKARWRCLLRDRTLHYHPHAASKITIACCVLHNIALKARLPPPSAMPAAYEDDDADDNVLQTDADSDSELIQGRAVLNALISRL